MSPFLGLSLHEKAQRPLSQSHIWPLVPQRASPSGGCAGWPSGPMRDSVCIGLPFLPRSIGALNELSTADFTKAGDPLALFKLWLQEAAGSEINDPEAMTLATVDAEGLPDARMVLCKGADQRGLVFYTNIESAKGRELEGTAAGGGAFPLEIAAPASPVPRAYRASDRGRERRLFRLAAKGEPDRRLGERAITAAGRARRSRSGGGSLRAAVRTRRRAATGLLARLSA